MTALRPKARGRRRLKDAVPVLAAILSIVIMNALAGTPGGGIPSFSENAVFVVISGNGAGAFFTERTAEPAPAESFSILKGADALFDNGVYANEPCTDEALVRRAEDALREVLALLPEGFTGWLAEDYPGGLVFMLCGSIRAKESGAVECAAALTFSMDGAKIVALDISDPYSELGPIIVHELCHVVDGKLEKLAKKDPSHWSEEAWEALNPPGFQFYLAYVDENGRPYSETGDASFTPAWEGEIWFCDVYSKTFPTEDRARLSELYYSRPGASVFKSPHIMAKLFYYFEAVKYYFFQGGSPSASGDASKSGGM